MLNNKNLEDTAFNNCCASWRCLKEKKLKEKFQTEWLGPQFMKLDEWLLESSEKTRETPDGIDLRGNRAAQVANCLQDFDSRTKEYTISCSLFLLHSYYTLTSYWNSTLFTFFHYRREIQATKNWLCRLLALINKHINKDPNNGKAHRPNNSKWEITCTCFLKTKRTWKT